MHFSEILANLRGKFKSDPDSMDSAQEPKSGYRQALFIGYYKTNRKYPDSYPMPTDFYCCRCLGFFYYFLFHIIWSFFHFTEVIKIMFWTPSESPGLSWEHSTHWGIKRISDCTVHKIVALPDNLTREMHSRFEMTLLLFLSWKVRTQSKWWTLSVLWVSVDNWEKK